MFSSHYTLFVGNQVFLKKCRGSKKNDGRKKLGENSAALEISRRSPQ